MRGITTSSNRCCISGDGHALARGYRRADRWILRRARNVRVLLARAARVDVAARVSSWPTGVCSTTTTSSSPSGSRHAYFGHEEWEPYAPGLKTLEDAITIRRRILIAFERAERETDPARQRELLTFVLVGGGPTGVELAGTLAEIARQTLRDEFRSIDTSRARIVLVEASHSILATFPETLQAAARESLKRLGIEIREGVPVTHIDAHGVMLAPSGAMPERSCGRPVVGIAPLVATLARPSNRAAASVVEPDLSSPGIPKSSWLGTQRTSASRRKLLPGVARRHAGRTCTPRRTSCVATRGESSVPFVYRNLGNMRLSVAAPRFADLPMGPLLGSVRLAPRGSSCNIVMLSGFRNRVVVLFDGQLLLDVPARGSPDYGDRSQQSLVDGTRVLLRGSKEQDPPYTCHGVLNPPLTASGLAQPES